MAVVELHAPPTVPIEGGCQASTKMGYLVWAIRLSSYVALFAFATVCLATGLYYLAELMEEYERTTKKALRYTIFVILGLHFLLLFEGFELFPLLVGAASHLAYLSLLPRFPTIRLTNLVFVLACVLFLASHLVWFSFFSSVLFQFQDVLGFFVSCVWLVPMALFVGLTADDDLPFTSVSATGEASGETFGRKKGKQNRLIAWLQSLRARFFTKPDDFGYKAF